MYGVQRLFASSVQRRRLKKLSFGRGTSLSPKNQSNPKTVTRPQKQRKGRVPPTLQIGILLACAILVLVSLSSCGASPTETAAVTPTATLVPTFSPTPLTVYTSTATEAAATPSPSTSETPVETATPEPVTKITAPAEPVPTEEPLEPTTAPAVPAGVPVEMKSPDYGMQAFLWWRPEVAQRDLELIRDAGFNWVKQGFPWREIEGSGKAQYDWSTTDRLVDQVESVGGLHLIARLDSEPSWASGQNYPNDQNIFMTPPRNNQDFAEFCGTVATRYKGRIAAYQVWNEPNLRREWGGKPPDPIGYVNLLKICAEAIRHADPDAIVISAGMAPTTRRDNVAMPDTEFLKQMYAAGAQPYFDALGAHGAGYKAPPEKDPGEIATDPNFYNTGDANCPGDPCRIYGFRHVEDLHRIMVENGDGDKQVVVLEFGWTTDPRPNSPYAWHSVTEEQQADYFVRAYQYAKEHWQPWIGVMSLIYMPNVDWTDEDEQYWWSIAIPNYPQFYPRKAYRDLAPMEK
jgi:hypothetical protein